MPVADQTTGIPSVYQLWKLYAAGLNGGIIISL